MQADKANQAGEGEWNENPETWGQGCPNWATAGLHFGSRVPTGAPTGAYEWFMTIRVVYGQDFWVCSHHGTSAKMFQILSTPRPRGCSQRLALRESYSHIVQLCHWVSFPEVSLTQWFKTLTPRLHEIYLPTFSRSKEARYLSFSYVAYSLICWDLENIFFLLLPGYCFNNIRLASGKTSMTYISAYTWNLEKRFRWTYLQGGNGDGEDRHMATAGGWTGRGALTSTHHHV